jgi:hypothetical protein
MSTATPRARPSDERAIERVGVCADGDNCSRYHCRACGRYWLGYPVHICDSVSHLEETIGVWIEEALEEDADVATCARKVLAQVSAASLSDAFLDAYGDRLIQELWLVRNGNNNDDEHRDQGKANRVARPWATAAQTSVFRATHGRGLSAQLVSRNARITATAGATQPPSQEH